MPGVTPVTIPVPLIVAIAGETELHTPLPAASHKVVVAVGHTVNVPVIAPAFGMVLTVTIFVAATVPQLLFTV